MSGKIPRRGTIRIAEPLMKVFCDGSRGIRIDDPNDISITPNEDEDDAADENTVLAKAKVLGNSLVKKKMYTAASDVYLEGIRKADTVPTLLSNRAQAYAMFNVWRNSLADAAASLTIRPESKKTWGRYKKALKMLSVGRNGVDKQDEAHQIIMKVLEVNPMDLTVSEDTGKSALDLKNEANELFRIGKYRSAVRKYTSALNMCGEVTRALLGNWALCSLNLGANLDAVAATAASIRIRPEGKAVIRLARAILLLGEPTLCGSILRGEFGALVAGNVFNEDKCEMLRCLAIFDFIKSARMHEPKPFLGPPKFLPPWIRGIEIFDAGPKGRGVRTCMSLKKGNVVLIEPPIAHQICANNDRILFVSEKEKLKASDVYIKHTILLRSRHEAVLTGIVDNLYDGHNQRPATAVEELIPNLGSCKVLLPSHHDYVLENIHLTPYRIESILSVNSHGDSRRSDLFPAVSMFNHSSEPNCSWEEVGGCWAIYVAQDVAIGTELTLLYHEDEETLRDQWGIRS